MQRGDVQSGPVGSADRVQRRPRDLRPFSAAGERLRLLGSAAATRVLSSADHRALFNSALLIGVLTLAAKVVTLGRDVLIASRFGTSDANDAFLASWILPGFLIGVTAGGFSGALIPVQIEARTKLGRSREKALIGEVMLLSTAIYLLIAVFLLAGNRLILPLLAHGYSDSKFNLAIQLSMIMLPAVVAGGMAMILSSILNANDKFGLAAMAPMSVPGVTTLILLLLPNAKIEWIAAGFVIGTGLQTAILYLGLHREGVEIEFGWHGLMPETRVVFVQFLVLAANGVVFNGLGVVDTAMASTLGSGSQSILTYAGKLIVPLLGISSVALGTAVFPYFSKLVAEEDWDGLRHTIKTYTRLILAFAIPLTAGIIFFSQPLVRLLFQRGEFTAQDTHDVSRVLATYSLLIPIETIAVMMSRVIVSLKVGRAMIFASIGIFIFNIIADYILKGFLGIQGIALASVCNQGLSLIFLICMWRHLQRTAMTKSLRAS